VFEYPDGRSKGCGVVEYSSPQEAQEAIKTLNKTKLLSFEINVREDNRTMAKFDNEGPKTKQYEKSRSRSRSRSRERERERGPKYWHPRNNSDHKGNFGFQA